MGRGPCCETREGLKRGAWTAEEDQKLISFIQRNNGRHGSWRTLPRLAGLQRCGKSCRLRWTNYLRPNIKRGTFSVEEERMIIHLHSFLGNRWSNIAAHLSGRTDNDVKNHWNTHLKKKLLRMGIDPNTHIPLSTVSATSPPAKHRVMAAATTSQMDPSLLSHVVQWELTRLEAHAKLAPTQEAMAPIAPPLHPSISTQSSQIDEEDASSSSPSSSSYHTFPSIHDQHPNLLPPPSHPLPWFCSSSSSSAPVAPDPDHLNNIHHCATPCSATPLSILDHHQSFPNDGIHASLPTLSNSASDFSPCISFSSSDDSINYWASVLSHLGHPLPSAYTPTVISTTVSSLPTTQ